MQKNNQKATTEINFPEKSRAGFPLFVICFIFVSLAIVRLSWGVPSAERNVFYPEDPSHYLPGQIDRKYETGPLDTFHPDEGAILNSLSNMRPAEGDFSPHSFHYPSLLVYLTGAALKLLELFGFIHLIPDKLYYLSRVDEMAVFYMAGRLICILFGLAGIILVYKISYQLTKKETAGIFSSLTLSCMPLWIRDSAFLAVNVPAATLAAASVYACLVCRPFNHLKRALPAVALGGFAAGAKYPYGLIILMPVVFYLKDTFVRRPLKINFFGGVFLAITGIFAFAVTTPYAFISPDEFLRDFLFEARGKLHLKVLPEAFLTLLYAIGPAFYLTGIVALWFLIKKKFSTAAILLAWLFLVSWPALSRLVMRYWIPALPVIACIIGIALSDVRKSAIGSLIIGSIFAYSFIYNLELNVFSLKADPRMQAASWIQEHIPEGSSLALRSIYFDLPPVNADRYKISWLNQDGCHVPSNTWHIQSDQFSRPWKCEKRKKVCQSFQNPITLFPFNKIDFYPEDLSFTHLAVLVYCPQPEGSNG